MSVDEDEVTANDARERFTRDSLEPHDPEPEQSSQIFSF
jgi:hypothetical protein